MQPIVYNNNTYYLNSASGYYEASHLGNRVGKLHRHIWEDLNSPIPTDRVVHHKDFNRINNDPTNLVLMTRSEHTRLHNLNRECSQQTRDKMSVAHLGKPAWNKGKVMDENYRSSHRGAKNGMYGRKEDPEHARLRGLAVSEGKKLPVTDQMRLDLLNGITYKQFTQIYGYGTTAIRRIKRELGLL